jgi:hypothetical protein
VTAFPRERLPSALATGPLLLHEPRGGSGSVHRPAAGPAGGPPAQADHDHRGVDRPGDAHHLVGHVAGVRLLVHLDVDAGRGRALHQGPHRVVVGHGRADRRALARGVEQHQPPAAAAGLLDGRGVPLGRRDGSWSCS